MTAEVRLRLGRLIVGDGSPPMDDVLLVISGERIVSVTPASHSDSAIDLRAYTAMPGLIDVHTHIANPGGPHGASRVFEREDSAGSAALMALANAQAHLRSGFTSIRVLGTWGYVDVSVRDAIDAGTFSGPRVFAAGHAIGTTGGHMDQSPRAAEPPTWVFDSAEEARRVARYQIKMGVDCIKIASDGLQWNPRSGGRVPRGPYREMSFEEIRAVCEVAEWAGVHVAAHTDGGAAMRDAVRAGVRTIEHIKDLSEDDVRYIADAGAFLVPTMVASANTVRAGLAASGLTSDRFAFFVRQLEWKKQSFERALRAGVNMVLGTDAGYALCRHGESAKELVEFVECGMTPLQAISAGTAVAADAIGQADDLGTLSAGKLADVLVLDRDPSADISVLTRSESIVRVYKGGVQVS